VHSPPNLFNEPITLLHVVVTTGGDHVGPFVSTSATARHHVINGVGVFEAVRASVTVTQQERAPRERRCSDLGGKLYHVVESNDGGNFDDDRRRAAHVRVLGRHDGFGPSGEHQNDGPSLTHELERLEGRIE